MYKPDISPLPPSHNCAKICVPGNINESSQNYYFTQTKCEYKYDALHLCEANNNQLY